MTGGCAYISIRLIHFPVRITERNVATQYFLAVRFTRILNVILVSLFLVLVFDRVEAEMGIPPGMCKMLTAGVGILLALAFIVYYIVAFKHK